MPALLAFLLEVWAFLKIFLVWARGFPKIFTPWLLKILSTGSIIYILSGLGFGLFVYKGLDLIFNSVIEQLVGYWGGAGAVVVLASIAGIPTAANAMLSAHAAGVAIKITALSLRRFGFIGAQT